MCCGSVGSCPAAHCVFCAVHTIWVNKLHCMAASLHFATSSLWHVAMAVTSFRTLKLAAKCRKCQKVIRNHRNVLRAAWFGL